MGAGLGMDDTTFLGNDVSAIVPAPEADEPAAAAGEDVVPGNADGAKEDEGVLGANIDNIRKGKLSKLAVETAALVARHLEGSRKDVMAQKLLQGMVRAMQATLVAVVSACVR